MKILIIHNDYQSRSGEEIVMEQEEALLRAHGHDVIMYRRANAELKQLNALAKLTLPARTIWSHSAARAIRDLIQQEKPDIAHIHNTHFIISPAAIQTCAMQGIPIVHTLHNFRLICPAATLFRDGHVCEDCVGKSVPYPGVLHACFRDSYTQSAAIAASTALHRLIGTYSTVNRFITPTDFARNKLIQGGLNPTQVVSKPHFLSPDPGPTPPDTPRRYMLFAGRLTTGKGIETLLEAWKHLPDVPLRVIGGGPLTDQIAKTIKNNALPCVNLLGQLSRERVYEQMRGAYALVLPSLYYETFGMVALEALAVGTPVIVTNHGSPAEIVQHGVTGWHVPPGDAPALAAAVRHAWDHPQKMEPMRRAARQIYLDRYTAERNYTLLMEIYQQVLNR